MDSFLPKPVHSQDKPTHEKHPSGSDLLGSAKLVAGAATAALRHEGGDIDKVRVAGAAADLLDAASRYGKLKGSSVGNYVEKAEEYLHKYNASHGASPGHEATPGGGESAPNQASGGGDSGGGGYGGYVKMAQGFLKK